MLQDTGKLQKDICPDWFPVVEKILKIIKPENIEDSFLAS